MANCISKPQEQDGPQNGGDCGHEDRKRTKFGGSSMHIHVRHTFQHKLS